MRLSFFDRTIIYFYSFFFSSPLAITAVTILFGPSTPKDSLPSWFVEASLPLLITITAIGIAFYVFLLELKRLIPFSISLFFTTVFFLCISIASGLLIHPDFFSAAFQHLLCLPAVIVIHFRNVPVNNSDTRRLQKNFANVGILFSFFYTQWVLMMGYAIATGQENRKIEALIYNIYNLCLVFILFFASKGLKTTSSNSIETGADSLIINGKNVTTLFGQKKVALLYALASSNDRKLRCADIQIATAGKDSFVAHDCSECLLDSARATVCGRYRTTNNDILELKKLLEFLEVGSITSSDNRRTIIVEGWKLILFENVRLITRKTG